MLKYRLVQRKNLKKDAPEGSKVVAAQLVSNGTVSFADICDEVAEQSSLTSGDLKNAIDRMVYVASKHLKNGQSVDLGDLGRMRIVIRSKTSESESGFDTSLMKTPKVLFTPGKKLRNMQEGVTYERVATVKKDGGDGAGGDDDKPVVV